MNDVQMFRSLCAECVEFLSQMRSGAVLMENRHGEGQTVKQGLLSSHLFLCLPCLILPFTVPCKMVLARPDERET